MFESIRFQWNAQLCSNYVNQLERILKSGDDVLIKDISEKALKHGRRALELGAVMDKPEIMVPLKDVLTHVGSIYEHMQQKKESLLRMIN